jgi:hypothetical protein
MPGVSGLSAAGSPHGVRASDYGVVSFPVRGPRVTPDELHRELLRGLGLTDADIAEMSRDLGYDVVRHRAQAAERQGGIRPGSIYRDSATGRWMARWNCRQPTWPARGPIKEDIMPQTQAIEQQSNIGATVSSQCQSGCLEPACRRQRPKGS